MPFKNQMVSIKINKDVHKLLVDHKEKTGVTITFAIEKAVEEYLNKFKIKE